MTDPAITSEVHKPLDIHVHFTAEITLYSHLADFVAQRIEVGFRQLPDLGVGLYPRLIAQLRRRCAANAVDIRQRNNRMLIVGNIYSGDTCHKPGLL